MRKKYIHTLEVVILLTAALPVSVAAAPREGAVEVTPELLTFTGPGGHDALRLTLAAPDGEVIEVRNGSTGGLSVGLVDGAGEVLADGLYAYELHGATEDGEVLVRSGFFTVRDGAFVSPEAAEAAGDGIGHVRAPASAHAAQTVNDDLSVNGSLCVGLDCFGFTAFGTDTIVMRENNTRILFSDTSSSAAFPTTDWALVANDTQNGGAERFSVENRTSGRTPFTLLGGTPDHALFVNSLGRVGLGTATPALELHVVDGDTPTLRLDQDASSNIDPQTWDLGGNELGFFIRDVTHAGNLPFRLRPGAPDDSLHIDATGNVGLGTGTPAARLHVAGSIVVSGTVDGRDVSDDGAALNAHLADLSNPHQVTAPRPAPTRRAPPRPRWRPTRRPSTTPPSRRRCRSRWPRGTGATDAATARANLGIVAAKAGNVPASAFAGNPAATATVTFATPFPAGTDYVVLLTAVTGNAKKLTAVNVVTKSAGGFSMTLGGPVKDLVEVGWLARPVGP